MKRLVIVTLLFAAAASFAQPAEHKPIVKGGYVMRTLQQDAELKDWIMGAQAENRRNIDRADQAEASLEKANADAMKLAAEVNALAKDDQIQKDKAAALGAENSVLRSKVWKLAWIISVSVGAVLALIVGILPVPMPLKLYAAGAAFVLTSGAGALVIRYMGL